MTKSAAALKLLLHAYHCTETEPVPRTDDPCTRLSWYSRSRHGIMVRQQAYAVVKGVRGTSMLMARTVRYGCADGRVHGIRDGYAPPHAT